MQIPEGITRTVNRQTLVLKKNSPHILFGVGVTGWVASTVLACRATLKLSETLDEIQDDVKQVHDLKSSIEHKDSGSYPVEEYRRDLFYVYTKSGLKIIKLYGVSAVVGGISLGAITGSHIQLTKRNTALIAAYTAVAQAYEDYRDRVRERVGKEQELDIYHATKTEVDEEGEIRKSSDPTKYSPYARFFDQGSSEWEKNAEYNRYFLECQQTYANHMLRARGHVFLNEIYDMLGLERSKAGAVVGWVIGKDGDNFIDFGLYNTSNSQFINGWEPVILLDFNVDGVIYKLI